jgi:hypothetical protein
VAGRRLDRRLRGQALREQAVLQDQRGGMLAGVVAGAVDAGGGAGDDRLCQDEIVLLKGLRPLVANEDCSTEREAPGAYRNHHDGVESVPGSGAARAGRAQPSSR